ncbi:NYN domain-containing protein [Candidatus Saccharibacteria bacterium]|nr:NYN domain-containing protein [Candidatus Saccharibacteria bacterium]
MEKVDEHNFAFIDAQNLYKSLKNAGWKLDYHKFRKYLRKRYKIVKAIVFIGKQERYRQQYAAYHRAGFELEFKEAVPYRRNDGKIDMKANVDVDLTVGVLGKYNGHYDKAVVVSGDGDFLPLYSFLRRSGKLKAILIPSYDERPLVLDEQELREYRVFMDDPIEKTELLVG